MVWDYLGCVAMAKSFPFNRIVEPVAKLIGTWNGIAFLLYLNLVLRRFGSEGITPGDQVDLELIWRERHSRRNIVAHRELEGKYLWFSNLIRSKDKAMDRPTTWLMVVLRCNSFVLCICNLPSNLFKLVLKVVRMQ